VQTETPKLPFYGKVTIFLIGFIALLAIMFVAKSIIIPIIFAIIIAILLHPVVKFLTRIKINRVVAIAFTLLLTFLLILGFIDLFIGQANRFSESWPVLIDKFTQILNQAISNISESFEINPQKIHAWITKTQGELINAGTGAIGQTLVMLGNLLVVVFLLPVYIFLILFYQPILLEFIHRFFGIEHKVKITEIISQIKRVIQSYLIGLVFEAIIIAILDTAALLILGIDYAVILGIIGAMLNVIPYLGGLVAVALPMMVALVTKSSPWYMVYIMAAYYFIQLIDNNYIVPYIVASKVKINALFSIIVVLAGNAIWGLAGMFLSIPLLAIVKLICDHIEPLKPWGFLLGDTMPPLLKIKKIFVKPKSV
jgi:predicted PurR-regulated permease PerM